MSDTQKFSIEKLDVENFPTWRVKMKYVLINKGVYKAVELGDDAVDVVDKEMDQKAMALIGLHVQDHNLHILEESTSAKDAWIRLENIYKSKSNARKLMLKKELNNLRKEDEEPLTKFVSRAKGLRDQLCAAGLEVKSEEVVWAVMAGLPREYDVIVTVLQTAEQLDDVDVLLSKLLIIEQSIGASAESDKALYSSGRGSGRQEDRRGQTVVEDRRGRTVVEDRRGQTVVVDRRGQTVEDYGRRIKGACWNCGIAGHREVDCSKPRMYGRAEGSGTRESGLLGREVALRAGSALNTLDWVLDSGASRHMTSDATVLTDIRPLTERVTFTGFMGEQCEAEAVGSALLYGVRGSKPGDVLLIRDVLYVPGAAANLLSIPVSVRNGAKFEFEDEKCYITVGGEVVAEAVCKAGVYTLSGQSLEIPSSAKEVALAATAAESAELWHRRYGHLGYENLARLQSGEMVTGIGVTVEAFKSAGGDICEPCVQAKQHRLPHPSSASDSKEPLELLHMDVCGPFAEPSLGGARYFATFLDDYSKLSVVRPLEFKSDVTAVTKEVICMLEKQSGRSVLAVRTDNGTEYVNHGLSSYFKAKGILHQKSVRYVPEQNGSAERLNRTLLERVRAMLGDSGLAKKLWAEAVVTANYIRNRSPVSTRDKTPWELFFGKKPDVAGMRVFGARAYVHDPRQLRGKLKKRSEMGYLVGYEPNGKGYRIYLDSGKMRTAVHAVFKESGKESGTIVEKEVMVDDSVDVEVGSGMELNDTPDAPESTDSPSEEEEETVGAPPGPAPGASSAAGGGGRYPSRERHGPKDWWKAATAMLATVHEPSTIVDVEMEPEKDEELDEQGLEDLDVEHVLDELIAEHGLEDGNARTVVLHLDQNEGELDGSEVVVCKEPDTAESVGAMLEFKATKGVLDYVGGTLDYGKMFGMGDGLLSYFATDYSGVLDTRSYTIGYVLILSEGAICWSSKRQPIVGALMREAECKLVAFDGKGVLQWLRMLVFE